MESSDKSSEVDKSDQKGSDLSETDTTYCQKENVLKKTRKKDNHELNIDNKNSNIINNKNKKIIEPDNKDIFKDQEISNKDKKTKGDQKFIEIAFKDGKQTASYNLSALKIHKENDDKINSSSKSIKNEKQSDLRKCFEMGKSYIKNGDHDVKMDSVSFSGNKIIIKPLTELDFIFIEVNKEAKELGGFDSPPPEIIVIDDIDVFPTTDNEKKLTHNKYLSDRRSEGTIEDFVKRKNISTGLKQRGRPPKKQNDTSSDLSEFEDYLFPPRYDKNGNSFFECPQDGCTKEFPSLSRVKRHYIVHTGKKPYKCLNKDCDKKFSRRDNMMQHYRAHCSVTKNQDKHR